MNLLNSLSRVLSNRPSSKIDTQSFLTPSSPPLEQVSVLAGGDENVVSMKVCALTRLRVELKSPVSLTLSQLPAPFVGLLPINERVIYLVAAEDISHWSV
ncbi:PTS transporter subunit EIIB [Nitrincola alkalilacustris]|uniref:PTS transporter subunit EIIB n=1 Tax=Nitrincola alkalilacustris TaxID=1571224 RepID=UPI00124E3C8F|nr:PTS transporter subunit EIIB [Nitrincola alkalilacustris]